MAAILLDGKALARQIQGDLSEQRLLAFRVVR